ncbi:MAG: hypothetical protein ACR2HZ_10085 [Gemmatimonadaceae bacterium]
MRDLPFWRAAALLLLLPFGSVRAQGIALGNDITLTVGGILSATVFTSNARFGLGEGQQSNFVVTELEDWWHGGDVRNMRLTLKLAGPSFSGDWRSAATAEGDLFGGFNGAGAFGDEQPVPRLRLAFAEVTNGSTTFRVGQDWSLLLGNIPVSVSHIGFPLGWGSGGFIGWRFPGIFLDQALTPRGASTKATLRLGVLKNSWVDKATADQPSAGEAGMPQLEARLNLDGTLSPGSWSVYLAGHWDEKDLNNVRPKGSPEPPENNLTSTAVQAGARVQTGAMTIHGNIYSGKAMGHHFAHIVQFGDIEGWGAWAQAGLELSSRWSIWLYYGRDDPQDDDLPADNSRLQSALLVPMLRFKVGPYSTGIEWLQSWVDYRTAGGGVVERSGSSVLYSVRFDF